MSNLLNEEEFKELKKEIAIKHGYSLSDDDPILMFITLNEFLLKQYQTAMENNLLELSDIVFNTKTDIQNHIKEQELALLRKIQEINNKNVSNVHEKIKEYFYQEAEAYKGIKNAIIKNDKIVKIMILINISITIILLLTIILK